jgi:hypothetical protein
MAFGGAAWKQLAWFRQYRFPRQTSPMLGNPRQKILVLHEYLPQSENSDIQLLRFVTCAVKNLIGIILR